MKIGQGSLDHKTNRSSKALYLVSAILLIYGLITVLTPNLNTLNSNGPKFLALAILNLLVYSYLLYINHKQKSTSIFSPFFGSKIGLVYLILLVFFLLSFIKAINLTESLVFFSKVFTTFIATLNISTLLIQERASIRYLVIGMSGLLIIESISVFVDTFQYIRGYIENINLIKLGYSNKNILAAALFIKLPFAIWLITFAKGWQKQFGILSLLLGFIAVLFMSARAFYLGLLSFTLVYLSFLIVRYFQIQNKHFIKTGLIYLGCLIVAFVTFSTVQGIFYPEDNTTYNDSFAERIATIADETKKDHGRLKIWKLSFEIIKENPVLGVGLGNWKIRVLKEENLFKTNFTYFNKAHNDFIEITAEAGIVAGLLFFSIFVFVIFLLIKSLSKLKSDEAIKLSFLPAFGIFAYFFDAFFNFPLDRPQIQALFAIYVGMGIAFSSDFSTDDNGNKVNSHNKEGLNWGKWLPIIGLALVLISVYILFLNFKSLKIQRIFAEEEATGKSHTNSSFYLTNYPSIPNLSSTGVPVALQIARKLINEKKYVKAIEILENDHSSPYDTRKEYFIAYSYFELQQPDSALKYIQYAYHQKPLYFDYTELYCKILEALERTNEIVPLVNSFLLKGKKEKKAWRYLGSYTYMYGDLAMAVDVMDSAYRMFPNDSSIIDQRNIYAVEMSMPTYSEALASYNSGDYENAIKYFIANETGFEELGGHNRFPKYLEFWALSHLNLGEIEEGKRLHNRILLDDPAHYPSLANLGYIAFYIEKNYEEAIDMYTRSISGKSADLFNVYTNLGALYSILNQNDKAIENYEKALKFNSSKEIFGNLHLLWKSKGNEEKAAYYKTLWDNYGQKRKPPDERRLSL